MLLYKTTIIHLNILQVKYSSILAKVKLICLPCIENIANILRCKFYKQFDEKESDLQMHKFVRSVMKK